MFKLGCKTRSLCTYIGRLGTLDINYVYLVAELINLPKVFESSRDRMMISLFYFFERGGGLGGYLDFFSGGFFFFGFV